ncbi:hypothetical protein [Hydrogenimonas cancrithermarum]|uniref:Uncharacterized protein n=1 Tax=Hydrogenimonas cancrithermarum TaxID=2993563 RepID=A0ABN6WVJ6_9BACT|nr:hypothetical protein [Hydrogenimonas cancrithermarum]BDY12876.1 hypothetical protein HCR_11880 [Hydrogenimonas cancrithermarum]BDY12993.1 hypothetical protein HCR_13050 [Hydrogenimonas cancrithermarum]
MAISPLTNIIFVNQNMHVAASVQNMQFNRYDMQNVAAQAMVNEKEKTIEETRQAEELHNIDPEREHTRQEAEAQEREREKAAKKKPKTHKDKGFTIDEDGNPHLDIHV